MSGLPELGTILTDVLLRVGGAEAGERGPWKPIGTKFCLLKANPGAGAPGEGWEGWQTLLGDSATMLPFFLTNHIHILFLSPKLLLSQTSGNALLFVSGH